MAEETIYQECGDVYCFSRGGSFLRRLWNGGDEGVGTLFVTSRRLVWIRAKGAWERLKGGPGTTGCLALDRLLAEQGGYGFDLSATKAWVSARGPRGYGPAMTAFSDLSVSRLGMGAEAEAEVWFRFHADEADTVFRRLRPAERPRASVASSPSSGWT